MKKLSKYQSICYNVRMENDFIKSLMSDKFILSSYEFCEQNNTFDLDHGIVHIKNVLEIAGRLLKLFDLDARQQLIIKTSLVFHDIGSIYGRRGHNFKSRVVAQQYLEKLSIFSAAELEEIYYDIEVHDNLNELDSMKYDTAYFVMLIDKLDFSRHRLVKAFESDDKWCVYKDIEKLEFSREGNTLVCNIVPSKDAQNISEDVLFMRPFFNHISYVYQVFCDHFNLTPVVLLKHQPLDLSRTNLSIVRRD